MCVWGICELMRIVIYQELEGFEGCHLFAEVYSHVPRNKSIYMPYLMMSKICVCCSMCRMSTHVKRHTRAQAETFMKNTKASRRNNFFAGVDQHVFH